MKTSIDMKLPPMRLTSSDEAAGQRRLASSEFLKSPVEPGRWFYVPADAWAAARAADAEDGGHAHVESLMAIEDMMNQANAFLARDDIDDTDRQAFLAQFMGRRGGEASDVEEGSVGYLFAGVMSLDPELTGACLRDAVCDEDLAKTQSFFANDPEHGLSRFLRDRNIGRPRPEILADYYATLKRAEEAKR